MPYKLVIGNKNYSSWSMRPWIWMKTCGIEFEEHKVILRVGDYQSEIKSFGAGSTVPILVDGELAIGDSLAILEYLAEKHPETCAWPEDSDQRALARSIAAEMHSGFYELRSAMPMNCRRVINNFSITDPVQSDIQRVSEIFTQCREKFHGGGDWLFGPYTIADAMYTPIVMRFNTYSVSLNNLASEYVQTVTSQHAVLEWMEDSKAETEVIESDEL